ncbi:MAG: c-type cytochrome [Planctomycetes bacterium]|nr:c-type cytochrome [Planctomycetota bacterium]
MSDPKDKAAMIAAIKKRMAEGGAKPAAGAGEKAGDAAGGAAGGEAASAGSGEQDVKDRIAALRAKMDAGKGKPAATGGGEPAKKAPAKKPSAANVYPVQPVNAKTFGDERLYGANTLNVWFVVGGLVLTVATLLMWRRDWDRDWKQWQEIFRQREIERMQGEVAALDAAVDPQEKEDLERQLTAKQAELDARNADIELLEEAAREAEGVYYGANQAYQIMKSQYDAMRYEYEEYRLAHADDTAYLDSSKAELLEKQEAVASLLRRADDTNQDMLHKQAALKEARGAVTEIERELADLTAARDRVELALSKIGPGIFNDYVRNLPLVDMLAPTLKVDKIVVDKLKDNYNFMYVNRVDMCITCHVAIDKPAYANWDPDGSRTNEVGTSGERVLNAHPRLDLFVSDSSPHPMGKFGCTVCHMGRGQAVEFERTFHTPAADQFETADEKEARWVADFGYDPERHYWDWPMVPSDQIYSSCWQCHDQQQRLDGVPEYNASRKLVENLGCYGCHKIQGLEYLRKPGPDLTNVAAKVDESWVRRWIMSPRSFRPSTRMPHFWNQSNTGAQGDELSVNADREWLNQSDAYVDDWRARNETEARAVAAYVYDLSKRELSKGSFEMLATPTAQGDAEHGKQLFHDRGCLGCHSLQNEGWTENTHGPELSAIGVKVSPQWLFNWILDPKKYFPTTIMPNLRLSEAEAWDITAFLMQQRTETEKWKALEEPQEKPSILEQIAVENLASVAGDSWAEQQVAQMKADGGERALELFVGQKTFERNGCSGCHLVPDHYDDAGIGTELTKEALKEITKFDFGFEGSHANPEAIGHSLRDWFTAKLTDPRVFDRIPMVEDGPDGQPAVVRYEQKVKVPGDKLKMPNFGLKPDEVELVVQFLLGLRADGIDPSMKRSLDTDEKTIERGSRLITEYNCTGCHRVGQYSSTVAVEGDDLDAKISSLESFVDDEAFTYDVWMAEPLKSGGQTLFASHDWLSDEFYDPSAEEDVDLYEWFEDAPAERPIPDELHVYGVGEGGMGRYIESKAYRPPTLRMEGAKVKPDWLFEFLLAPYTVRNHVEVRMPTFGLTTDESLAIVRWFNAQADQPWPFEVDKAKAIDQELLDEGHELFTATFRCNSCHPAGGELPSNPDKANWGPDLSMAKDRLKVQWIHDWITDPPRFAPGTKMPNFLGEYSDGEYDSPYEDEVDLHGEKVPDWKRKLESLVQYLEHMNAASE